ncbi:solute carrier family 25 member 35 isoform X5 [Apis cerana]|uniref:solute carrier family 25 member 35 isoform X5 n=1 Tax=Apis cerana TaxID=7461 RepID=UPI002B227B48|nr:solute carrier family 25 member 35 isoform X5 [Apis cerana]
MTAAPNSNTFKSPGIEFVIGGLAAVGAGFFTNPIDVIKVRLQLQGELEARSTYKKIYKNTLHAGYLIAKHEGNTDIIKTAVVTGTAGCIGAVLGSPFYMIKTQLQAQSAQSIAVGYQHNYLGTWYAFKTLWKEGGIVALYRGWYAGIPRIFIGSATQLTTFDLAADWLRSSQVFINQPILLTFFASVIGGSCVAFTIQPFDVLATRLYNQRMDVEGKGTLYNGLLDAFVKIIRTEGLIGLYKGIFPTWMRIAPHTVLCLVFYEKLDQLYYNIFQN